MSQPFGLLLTHDLMFTSKVTGTGAALGIAIETASTCEQLHLRVSEPSIRVVFLDLNCPEAEPVRVMSGLSFEGRPRVIAFGSHVDEAGLASARTAGCDDVMPRSKFSMTLPELLISLFSSNQQDG